MKKQTLTKEFLETLTPVSFNYTNRLYKTKEGEFVKIFTPIILNLYNSIHVNLEAKLLNKEKYFISEDIKTPNTIYYSQKGFAVGYKMKPAIGINYNEFDKTLTLQEELNLMRFNHIHKKLEEIVKKNKDIVFPDLCTCDNIHIGQKDKIELIDYDGLQIGKYKAIQMSTTLNELENNYYIPKYYQIADVFATASRSETQGLTVIEAMASSLPVIAADDDSFKEIVVDDLNGYLFKNKKEYRKIMSSLIENKDKMKFLSKQARISSESYSSKYFAERILKVYESALNGRNPNSKTLVGRIKNVVKRGWHGK